MPGLEHSLRRSPSSLPCRGPWQTTPRTRAAREQLERLEQLPPDYLPQNPAPAQRGLRQPPGPAGSPGTGLSAASPARHPWEKPRTAGSPPMCQKRMFAATRPTSPLCWPGQARPAAQLRSAALSSTPRTSVPSSSPTRQGPPGCPRPFCDARGRGSSMRARVRAAPAGAWGEWRHRGRRRPLRRRSRGAW